jgi:IS605 OrfB family transposase
LIAKRVTETPAPGTAVVLEDPTGIRGRAKGRGPDQRRRLHGWSFSRLRDCIADKCAEHELAPVTAHEPDLLGLRHGRPAQPQEPEPVRLRRLRLPAQRRAQHRPQAHDRTHGRRRQIRRRSTARQPAPYAGNPSFGTATLASPAL